ncbi:hypothetical protein [Actinoplanes sp. RD1]|uniref:hypothetical protein n=1 Tax=Actinoplanes sp. RD1 TaxID=3064538 RepID=UPI0027413C98|nr:hypothetical protein [Actinoplanes sp. RD1]
MRNVSRVLAGLAVAGIASLGSLTLAGPASAGGSGGSLVDVTVQDVLTGNEVNVLNDVQIPVAAALCGLNVEVLTSALVDNNQAECKALSVAGQKQAWVKK